MDALIPAVRAYALDRIGEFEKIDERRARMLVELSDYVEARLHEGATAELIFICTHNSRRSHMAQIWAQTAAAFFTVRGVRTYSGGTEATAFNRNAVRAISTAGFLVEQEGESENPVYRVRYAKNVEPMRCFSKRFDHRSNPARDFCAVMTCAQADEACPVIPGASTRVSLAHEDPKEYDGTGEAEAKYNERLADIAREMLFAFSRVDAGLRAQR